MVFPPHRAQIRPYLPLVSEPLWLVVVRLAQVWGSKMRLLRVSSVEVGVDGLVASEGLNKLETQPALADEPWRTGTDESDVKHGDER